MIRDNEGIGLHLRGNARAHLRHVQVARTAFVTVGGESRYGSNVAVSDGAVLELRGFLVRGAAMAGLFVQDGFLTAEDGVVEGNAVGLHLSASYVGGYRWDRCLAASVAFNGNGTRVWPLAVAEADPDPGAAGSGSTSGCLRVPWP